MKTKDKEKDDMICLGVRIPKEIHAKLAKVAKSKDLTISQLVRIAIKNAIANNG